MRRILLPLILCLGILLTSCANDTSEATGGDLLAESATIEVEEPLPVSSEETEVNDDNGTPEAHAHVDIQDFSIEGKWKSVGDSGFGQAQPGAIVAFDGINCNFFSPKDTYAFYQDGDTYKLDATSFLFAETLTFTVDIIDEDHIVITSGQTVTELERIE